MSANASVSVRKCADRLRAAIRNHDYLSYVPQPDRLDLNELHIRMAAQAGVKLVISTDAHRVQEFDCMRYGVDQARRGWCEASDISNTRHVGTFRKLIEK